MTKEELLQNLNEKGVPKRFYAFGKGDYVEKQVMEKKFHHYEVYRVDRGIKHHVHKFKTEEEACDYFYERMIEECRYTDIPLKGIEPLKHKEPIIAPKWLHEDMAHTAEREGINVTYTRDIHSITFKNGYKYESDHFFEDRFYKGNAIVCMTSSNRNGENNHIDIPENVFMINDSGERIWTFRRGFIFPDRNVCVNNIGLSYKYDELYLYVYDDKHYRPQYTIDPSTGKLLEREEEFARPRKITRKITFRQRKSR